MYNQPWRLVPNQVCAEGGREIMKFCGQANPCDTPNGAEAWIGSVTRANGATPKHPNLGCAEVNLPDGRRRLLLDVIEESPVAVLGRQHMEKFGTGLGILVKYLDAKKPFLLQCHPSRKVAAEIWGSNYGKTECWHVLSVREDTSEPPFILLGFKPGVTREAFEAAYYREDMLAMEAMCHKIRVSPGETYFVPSGMPHALGEGCFVIEAQEPSDLTAVPVPQNCLIAFRQRANPQGVFISIDDALYNRRVLESFDYTGYSLQQMLNITLSRNMLIRNGEWGEEQLLIGEDHTPYFRLTKLTVNTSSVPLELGAKLPSEL